MRDEFTMTLVAGSGISQNLRDGITIPTYNIRKKDGEEISTKLETCNAAGGSVCASVNFHDTIFTAVLKAPINLFFDVTKTGQIINRFSSDMDHVDVQLPTFGIQFFQNSMYVFAAVVVCAISNVYFVPFLIPIGLIYYTSQYYYRKSSREVKRLEGISRSPNIFRISRNA